MGPANRSSKILSGLLGLGGIGGGLSGGRKGLKGGLQVVLKAVDILLNEAHRRLRQHGLCDCGMLAGSRHFGWTCMAMCDKGPIS